MNESFELSKDSVCSGSIDGQHYSFKFKDFKAFKGQFNEYSNEAVMESSLNSLGSASYNDDASEKSLALD